MAPLCVEAPLCFEFDGTTRWESDHLLIHLSRPSKQWWSRETIWIKSHNGFPLLPFVNSPDKQTEAATETPEWAVPPMSLHYILKRALQCVIWEIAACATRGPFRSALQSVPYLTKLCLPCFEAAFLAYFPLLFLTEWKYIQCVSGNTVPVFLILSMLFSYFHRSYVKADMVSILIRCLSLIPPSLTAPLRGLWGSALVSCGERGTHCALDCYPPADIPLSYCTETHFSSN